MTMVAAKNPLMRIPNGFGDIDIDHDFTFLDSQGDPVAASLEISYTPGAMVLHVPSVQEYLIHWKSVRTTKENVVVQIAQDILDIIAPFFLSVRVTIPSPNGPDVTIRWQWQRPSAEDQPTEFPEPLQ